MPKFVQRHQSQLYLLPPDLRDWLPEDDLAHFVVEAVERVPLERFQVNERGTGSAQYHPRMMLALLVYCYANGIFGSRRIERATYRDIGVRYVAANCHPDHDTICTFRRSNFDAVAEAFLQVLLLAKELQLLRVGTVSVDGTKVDANANKRNSLRSDRAGALREQLRGEIEGLLDQAEHADTDAAPDPQGLPEELSRRDKLRVKLDRACAELERRAQARADSERAEYERKVAARERRTGSRKGRHIEPPTKAPEAKEQINLTDADSALMRKSRRHEYRQAYNAQAAVDADGSQLVLGARVSAVYRQPEERKAQGASAAYYAEPLLIRLCELFVDPIHKVSITTDGFVVININVTVPFSGTTFAIGPNGNGVETHQIPEVNGVRGVKGSRTFSVNQTGLPLSSPDIERMVAAGLTRRVMAQAD